MRILLNTNKWICRAPSNIALIKYMGKLRGNIPCNSSLSYTLDRLATEVALEPCSKYNRFITELDKSAAKRFLKHLKNIKKHFGYKGFFQIESSNNFPKSAGIASSASSFAALTKCAVTAICEINSLPSLSLEEMSRLSRKGSGSSCRSFFSPWSLWKKYEAKEISLKIGSLDHDLALVNSCAKTVSSNQAHRLVKSSLLFKGRAQRAEKRLQNLIDCFNTDRWSSAYQICHEEFWDMHVLFETSSPCFGYIHPETIMILEEVRKFWRKNNDGPIVTIDAGPNVHFLWRKNQKELRKQLKEDIVIQNIVNCFL
ncbi:MAG: hypothetical protein LBF57_03725 [Holosporaceae bacterium]|jgi:diphosphomevalonate decarboxylase|nr:hypothetical protein [Holosporaceae bacterium]